MHIPDLRLEVNSRAVDWMELFPIHQLYWFWNGVRQYLPSISMDYSDRERIPKHSSQHFQEHVRQQPMLCRSRWTTELVVSCTHRRQAVMCNLWGYFRIILLLRHCLPVSIGSKVKRKTIKAKVVSRFQEQKAQPQSRYATELSVKT